jgi:hypothetical protein
LSKLKELDFWGRGSIYTIFLPSSINIRLITSIKTTNYEYSWTKEYDDNKLMEIIYFDVPFSLLEQ